MDRMEMVISPTIFLEKDLGNVTQKRNLAIFFCFMDVLGVPGRNWAPTN